MRIDCGAIIPTIAGASTKRRRGRDQRERSFWYRERWKRGVREGMPNRGRWGPK